MGKGLPRGGAVLVGVLMAMLVGGCRLPFASGEVQLTRADDWRLVVTRSQELAVVYANGRSGAGDFTRPPTLNEAGAHFLHRDGRPVTVVAGPVDGQATGVFVRTVEGVQAEAQIVEAYGMHWFWTELPGEVRPAELIATDAEERIVDEFTLPPMPGPPPLPIPEGAPPG